MAMDRTPSLTGDPWDALGGHFRYGAVPIDSPAAPGPENHLTSAVSMAPPYSPKNPIFWAALALTAAVLGFWGAGAKVRVGPAKASVDVGKGD